MGLLDKVKKLSALAVEAAKETSESIKEKYENEGAEGLGKALGAATKKAAGSVAEYASEVNQDATKTGNRAALIYNEQHKTSQDITRGILAIVGAGRKITLDAVDVTKGAVDKFNSLEDTNTTATPPTDKPKSIKPK
jgi:hypothetical protein